MPDPPEKITSGIRFGATVHLENQGLTPPRAVSNAQLRAPERLALLTKKITPLIVAPCPSSVMILLTKKHPGAVVETPCWITRQSLVAGLSPVGDTMTKSGEVMATEPER